MKNSDVIAMDMLSSAPVVPPLKWAGGKRWFVARHMDMVPAVFNNYIEPFVGSGAMFFALQPPTAVLSDANADLINLYECIRDFPGELESLLRYYHARHCAEFYYEVRKQRPRVPLRRAARMLYLNRTCWNGLYRVNKRGEFNVPIGTKASVVLESDDFARLSKILGRARLVAGDFEATVDSAMEGDFVFVDPPYTVAHNNNGFVKYNEDLFGWADQQRLRACVGRAAERGAKVLITNAAHASIYELYDGFEQVCVSRAGVIAGASRARGQFNEVLIKCY
ncbi:Dam family site-specific DNA-(adenine-N6)-methyltransferase [Stenotrophomonas maltophilia group sp. msm1]|uniref:DNA adenine methylase n=1 Tax=Stenotrophomonas maltophilia group sp. msm1 TaxID=3061099 RepID=UPI0028942B47|nr:Dam family site-specific DNA-(adenine-N6)-methyltransferase [Stenotrophomonas maltophilia group sp. msm1]MDT3556281.1 Dam family site-specific DNA-(adenine-N6)-methyltransferase [Stenotrophomonas maltophilia group sp. msm1]